MKSKSESPKRIVFILLGTGLIGLVASITLLIEKIALIKDPAYIPSCSINPILSCGSIMKTSQAEAFGFPNPILGVVGFTIVLTTALAILAGAKLERWYWLSLQVGVTFGIIFIHWLIFQSLYRIGALCPYCIAVWAVMIPLFLYVTLYNLSALELGNTIATKIVEKISEYHTVVLTSWYLTIGFLVAKRFWNYWQTLL